MNWLITLIKEWEFGKGTALSNQDFLAMFSANPSVEVMQRVRAAKIAKDNQEQILAQEKMKKILVKLAREGIREAILKGRSTYCLSLYDLRPTYGNIGSDVFTLETFKELVQPGLTISWQSGSRSMIVFEVH